MKTLTVNGIELATIDRGEGPALLLVHGFPLDHTMWNDQIDALGEKYRVIAPDLRGFGRSGVTRGTVTMEQFADDVAALLDVLEIQEPIVFCGLSMGGYVAWQFWRKYSRRLRGLILCDTRAVADTPETAEGRLEMAQRVLSEGPSPLVEMMMPKLFAQSTVQSHPDTVDSLRRVMYANDPEGIAAAGRGMAQREDFSGMLKQIECPSLILVGELDALSTPEEMKTIADAIPGSRFVEIAASGHMSPMEEPWLVNEAILEFLGTLPTHPQR